MFINFCSYLLIIRSETNKLRHFFVKALFRINLRYLLMSDPVFTFCAYTQLNEPNPLHTLIWPQSYLFYMIFYYIRNKNKKRKKE